MEKKSLQRMVIQPNSQLLPDGSRCFYRSAVLKANHLDKVNDPTQIAFFILFARETLDLNRNGRIRLPLYPQIV